MNIIRKVVETHHDLPLACQLLQRHARPNYMKFLFQGEVKDEDYVCPTTVKIYTLWKNYNGEDRIGPEITGPSPESVSLLFEGASSRESKLRLDAAVTLTKLFRESQ